MSVRLSIRMEQLGTLWSDVLEILYLCIIRKSAEKSRVSLRSYFLCKITYIFNHISLNSY